MQTEHLQNMQSLGNISISKRNNPIVKLYNNDGKFMLLDVVLFTAFQQYYAYEVSKENLLNFIRNKNNQYLLPKINQLIYKVNSDDFSVIGIHKCEENNLSDFTFWSEKIWECQDLKQIQLNIN